MLLSRVFQFCVPAFLLTFAATSASAIVNLNISNQNFALTGIGANAAGSGQSKMTWGTCAYDGTNTSCTLSGTYTGFGNGGTYSFVISYAGNGAFPLIAVTQPGSDYFTASALSNFSLVITLNQNSGPALHFYSFANFSFLFSSPTCTGLTAANCSVSQVGVTPNAVITGPITGSFDPTPTIRTSSGVITAGGYGGFASIAPATWIEIYGFNLATTLSQTWSGTDFVGTQAPSALGGTTVTVAGKPAYVNFVSPGQVNVQVPSGIPNGSQPVVLTTAGGTSLAYTINVNSVQPGLLAPPSFLINGRQNVVALFSNTLTFVLPNTVVGAATARAKPGDTITLYGIGFGLTTPDTPAGQIAQNTANLQSKFQITFAGVPATVTYAGIGPNNVGLYQFNVVVPRIPASDLTPVAFTLDGAANSQNLYIAIAN